MNATRSNLVFHLFLLLAVIAMFMTPGCGGKAPQEANDALDKVLTALAEDDSAGFVDLIVPDQRDGIRDVDEMEFFGSTMSSSVDNKFDLEVTDTSAMILVKLFFDAEEKKFSNVYFVMKKVDGKWLFDVAETIKKEREADGADAFAIWEWGE